MNAPLNLDATLRSALPQKPAIRTADDSGGVTPQYREKVQAAAEKFEGFFIGQMLRQMRQSTRELAGEDSIYNNSVNQDMLDMADTQLADALASQRAFGIADAILRQLLPSAVAPAAVATAPLKNSATTVASAD
jgi:flagellar protein FlgJ